MIYPSPHLKSQDRGGAEIPTSLLRWTDADGRQGVCPLTGEELVIGRQADAGLVLTAGSVSRHHAKIVPKGPGFSLIDLESRRGTYVNGQPIQECQLRHGDRIRLGKEGAELLYVLDEAGTTRLTDPAQGYDFEKSFQDMASILTPEKPIYSNLEKISCILDFHYSWGKGFSAEKTFEQILKSALPISGAERGFILLKQPEGFRYALGLDLHGVLLPQSDFRGSQTVVRRVTEGGSPIFMTQEIAREFAQQLSIVSTNVRAIACLPLEGISFRSQTSEVVGILYLESTKKMHALSGLDQKILTKLAEEAGSVLEKLEMIKGLEERKKMEQELALAQETQRSLLPRS
ncbi:MAG: FHA domain-containing protein, partial [Acidobacteria bacterium]|nr:FHA domain-containing protein [Acidobacteriota bacterium]